ncbi:hypothetical protein GYMLUDRAFT_245838 [Collybiopsis luxurians FD-317 M1]|uniref:F-box domain-containing protein n=1 Tax=Collybiopsis luxurians FD-317 M1 TaxID=944289 RepID=A0A0D0CSR5_9AGAR|nr:hypothetical protein GYMLUDRAFT_245838 [Collybiopsis luxurians FD-317 M1]
MLTEKPGQRCNLLSLPLEVKFQVISYLNPEDIFRLSNTCHIMRYALFSTVFRRVVIRPIIDNEVMSRAQSSKSRNALYRTLNKDGYVPENILPVVRECIIREWRGLLLKAHAIDALLTAYTNSLRRMDNIITSLTLINITLTPSLLLNIQKLSYVRSLTLISCDFGQVTTRHVRDFLTPLNLEKFELFGASWVGTSTKNAQGIRAAFLSSMENIVELKHDQLWLTKFLSSSSITPPLQVLNIHLGLFHTSLHEAFSFINRIPTLVSVTIEEDNPYHEPIYLHPVTERISLSSLPRLHRLICPPRFISALIGPHTISQLSFTITPLKDYSSMTSAIWPLSETLLGSDGWSKLNRYQSVQVLHLPVGFAFGITDTDGIGLSQLKELTVDAYSLAWPETEFSAEELHSFALTFSTPSLRYLRFINMPFTKPARKDTLVEIQSKYFTGLDRFSFWLSGGDRWDLKKDPVDRSWKLYDPAGCE